MTATMVMATHPKSPNMEGHARSRVRHLAIAPKVGKSLTLCNMLVSGIVTDFEKTLSRRTCSNCSQKLTA